MAKLNLNKPLTVFGKEATILYKFDSGRVAVLVEGEQVVRTFAKNQMFGTESWRDIAITEVQLVNKVERRVEYVAFYPQKDAVYGRNSQPYQSSMYGLDQIVQVKLTYEGDRLIAKELV